MVLGPDILLARAWTAAAEGALGEARGLAGSAADLAGSEAARWRRPFSPRGVVRLGDGPGAAVGQRRLVGQVGGA